MMKRPSLTILFFALLLCSARTNGEEKEEAETKRSLFLLASASVGNFSPNAGERFKEIYSNRTVSKNFAAALGSRNLALIGKYREFSATGRSIVTNAQVDGKAEWKQKIYMAGIRLRDDEMPLYLDILFVSTRADESIMTVAPEIPELSAVNTKESRGFGGAVGIAIKLAGIFGIFAEAEYSSMTGLEIELFKRPTPNLGGMNLNAGIQLSL